jgi:hypothetical protein
MNQKRLIFALAPLLVAASGFCQEPLVPQSRLEECVASAVEFAKRSDRVNLDFSPRSLGYVDAMMNDFYSRKFPFEKVKGHVRVMGCYTGAVFARNLGGKWIYPKPEDVDKLGPGPFLELADGIVINPIVKVQSIFEDGLEHSVFRFYGLVESAVQAKKRDAK